MKKLRAILSVVLSIVMLMCCIPFSSMVSAEDTATDTVYTIFMADPAKYGEAGTDVTATDISDATSKYTVYNRVDDEGTYYYSYTGKYTNGGGLYAGASYAKGGLNNNDLAWIGQAATLKALEGLIDASFDYRITINDGAADGFTLYVCGANTSDGLASTWARVNVTQYGAWATKTSTPTSISNFYSGYLGLKADYMWNSNEKVNSDVNYTVDFRNIKLTVKESNRDAINTALANIGSDYTFDTLIAPYLEEEEEEKPTGTEYVIYKSNPFKAGVVGTDVSRTIASGAKSSRNPVYVASEEDSGYFTYSDFYATSGQNQWNRRHFFYMGYDNKIDGFGWMSNTDVTSKILDKITFSMKVRITATATSGTAPTKANFHFNVANQETADDITVTNKLINNKSVNFTGEWIEFTVTPTAMNSFYSGYGVIWIEPDLFDGTLKVDIKDITFTINDNDKADIDTALEGTGWDFDSLVANYLDSGLINPDEASADTDVIWYANPDRVTRNAEADVTATKPSDSDLVYKTDFKTIRMYNDADGVFYRSTLAGSGRAGDGTSSIFKSGITYDSFTQMDGWGWLNNRAVFEAIAPYIHLAGEYRFDGVVPEGSSAPYIYMTGTNGYHALWQRTLKIQNPGEWNVIPERSFTLKSNATSPWYDSLIAISIYCDSGGFSGTQKIDIRNLHFEFRACDRVYINAALSKVEGIDSIPGFTEGIELATDINGYKDYYSLFVSAAKGEAYDVNDDGSADVLDLVRMKKYAAWVLGYMPAMLIERADFDQDGDITATDVSAFRSELLK